MPNNASQYAFSSFCVWPEKCAGAARTPQGLVALHDDKPGTPEDLVDTPEAYAAFFRGLASGELGYENLTAKPRKSSFSGATGYYCALEADGIVIVTSKHEANDPAHPGLRFSREEWDVLQAGCEADELALKDPPVLTA